MSGKLLLECKDVYKSFDGKNDVLRGVNLKVYERDFVSILGESGSGKSTLLGLLGGMDVATKGQVVFEGVDLGTLKEKELALLRRTKLGFVFQFFNLAPYLTVEENVLLPIFLDGKPIKKYEKMLEEMLSYLKISEYKSKMPGQLSGGEQQRVAIARGLIYNPKIIFLDEPTGNLDSKNSEEIMALLRQINQERNTTIIQVTHSENNALYGNRIIRLSDGQITSESIVDREESLFDEAENAQNEITEIDAEIGFAEERKESVPTQQAEVFAEEKSNENNN